MGVPLPHAQDNLITSVRPLAAAGGLYLYWRQPSREGTGLNKLLLSLSVPSPFEPVATGKVDLMSTPTVAKTATKAPVVAEARNWTELVDAIRANHGVAMVPMETLRRLEGAQRLGVHVLSSISKRVSTMGVGHVPEVLPNRQDQDAVLYLNSTAAGELVTAVREGVRDARTTRRVYNHLHQLNSSPEPTEVIRREEFADKLSTAAEAVLELLEGQGMSRR